MNEQELLELAWGLICNASNTPIEEGPVDATPGWAEAAVRFRKLYFDYLDKLPYEGDKLDTWEHQE